MSITPLRLAPCAVFLALALAVPGLARDRVPTAEETRTAITALLREFLGNVDDPAMHARFWADDLVYTTGQGVVRSKSQIVEGVAAAAKASRAAERTTYGAEEVQVRPYGTFAALNFRLLVRNPDGTTWYSRNSGAFLWREGRWQVVTWQATRETEPAK